MRYALSEANANGLKRMNFLPQHLEQKKVANLICINFSNLEIVVFDNKNIQKLTRAGYQKITNWIKFLRVPEIYRVLNNCNRPYSKIVSSFSERIAESRLRKFF